MTGATGAMPAPLATAQVPVAPVQLSREQAAAAAAAELSKPEFHVRPPVLTQALQWLAEHVARLLHAAAGISPGRSVGLVVLVTTAVAAGLAVRHGLGPRPGRVRTDGAVFEGGPISAEQHRQAADQARWRGEHATAVRERFRALARELEERGVVDSRPGRTARETARVAGSTLPAVAPAVTAAARTFDEVAYGGAAAGAEQDETVRRADDMVRGALRDGGLPSPGVGPR
ncbi:MAG: DUF4129 domain-containing protein [Actinomycetes bacterium]